MRLRYLPLYLLLVWFSFARLPNLAVYAQATPSCIVLLSNINLAYDEEQNQYNGTVTIGNDFYCVATIVLRVEGADGLKLIEESYRVNGDLQKFSFSGAQLIPEQKYVVTVIPLGDTDQIFVNDDEPVQMPKEFVHRTKPPPQPTVQVLAVNMEHTTGKLSIDLDVTQEERISSYEGYIRDKESGAKIHTLAKALYATRQIAEALAATNPIRSALEPGDYELLFCLNTKDDNQVCADPYAFKPGVAPQLAWWQKVFQALGNPAVYAPILIILMSTIGWVIVRNARDARGEPQLRRPPMGGTDTVLPSSKQAASLVLQIIQSPGMGQPRRQRINRFPFSIGRSGCDLNLPKDIHISKQHLEIDLRSGNFYVTDLGSVNHTYINDRELAPQKSTRIQGVTVVRLGPHTELELDTER